MNNSLVIILILLGNFWIWRIFQLNFLVFIVLIISTYLLYLSLVKRISYKVRAFLLVTILILFYLQWQTTAAKSLILLDNDEQRVQQERLKFYNSVGTESSHYIRIIFYRLDLRNFLEGDFNTISTRLQRNFFESIDPNIYFFAGHPRERVWAEDFEKFPFVLVAPFLIGFYKFIKDKKKIIFWYTAFSLILLSIIGHKNNLGPFIFFPMIAVSIFYGVIKICGILKSR